MLSIRQAACFMAIKVRNRYRYKEIQNGRRSYKKTRAIHCKLSGVAQEGF